MSLVHRHWRDWTEGSGEAREQDDATTLVLRGRGREGNDHGTTLVLRGHAGESNDDGTTLVLRGRGG